MPYPDPRRPRAGQAVGQPPTPAREVRPWRRGDPPMTERSWPTRGPLISVYVEGAWRRATVTQRQDRADGVAIEVEIILPSVSETSRCLRLYAWDPGCMRVVEPPAGNGPV